MTPDRDTPGVRPAPVAPQSPPVGGRPGNEGGDMLLYWRSLSRHKWSIAGLAIAIAILAEVLVSLMTPVYRSTVTLMIEQNKAKFVSIEELYSGISSNREYFQTQAEVLKSRTLAARVVAKLDLVNHPEFDPRRQEPSLVQQVMQHLGIGPAGPADPATWDAETLRSVVVAAFMSRLSVEPVRMSQLIKVSFESENAGDRGPHRERDCRQLYRKRHGCALQHDQARE